MRTWVTVVLFVVAGPTFAGILLTALLSTDAHGLDVSQMFGPIAGIGFLLAIPFSYVVAAMITKRMNQGVNRNANAS